MAEPVKGEIDYSLANPDTLTKYKQAGAISQKALEAVCGWCVADAVIVELCERGDKLLDDEIAKVYKGNKVPKGVGHPTTVSPSSYITPYTPLKSDAEEAAVRLKAGECVKVQLGVQIDGFCTIVCDNVVVGAPPGEPITGRMADLLLATHYANEVLLRLMLPPGLVGDGDGDAAPRKPYSQGQMTQLVERVAKSFGCTTVESTTIWLFDHNEIEAKKKIILSPGEGVRGEGLVDVGEVWGVEMGISAGTTGKVKNIANRATLHRRTTTTYGLKRPTSRQILSEIVRKFATFPFSLRQLDDEKAAKIGVVECVRGGVLRQYDVVGDKNGEPVARLFTTVALSKHGMTRLAAPPALDVDRVRSEHKITDPELLRLLDQPVRKPASKPKKPKKKKKAAAAKKDGPAQDAAGAAAKDQADSDDSSSGE